MNNEDIHNALAWMELSAEVMDYMKTPKTYQALIQWSNLRLAVPTKQYSAPAEFEDHEGEFWSLVLRIGSPYDEAMRLYYADIWFLADNAPHDWLKPNARFVLYEGHKMVAAGRCMHEFVEIQS